MNALHRLTPHPRDVMIWRLDAYTYHVCLGPLPRGQFHQWDRALAAAKGLADAHAVDIWTHEAGIDTLLLTRRLVETAD